MAEAAQLYHRILAIDPAHVSSMQNLGAIALNAGRPDMAVDLFGRALAINKLSPELECNLAAALHTMNRNDDAVVHCQRAIAIKSDYVAARMVLGNVLRAQGKPDESIACYRRALKINPDHAETLASLGISLTEQGQFDEARQCFERSLALNPNDGRTHFGCGGFYLEQGDLTQAIDCYLRAMELRPDDMRSHYNFCAALMALSKFDAVTEYYEQFLAIRPNFAHGYNHLAWAYNAVGNTPKALETLRRGLAIAETPQGKSIFVQCLTNLNIAPDPSLRGLIVRAVSEPWGRPLILARHCVALIRENAEIEACIARGAAAWPALLPADQLFGASGLSAMSQDELLRVYLANSRVVDLPMEKFATALRFALLEAAISARADAEVDAPILALYCALARQCFVVEYAFRHTDEEITRVNSLRDTLSAALRAGEPISTVALAAVAAYMPLHSLPEHERLLTGGAWPQPIDALLTQQIREPAEERRLRTTIRAITPIQDQVSVAVRGQYEDNPYPRWIETPIVENPVPINSHVRSMFPRAEFRHLTVDSPASVLIAGCGTGQSLVDYVVRLAGAHTLAVDLSLTSMAYAKRKMESLGLGNVELAQADILELGSLGRSFDFINCGGVLHHLGDPMAGWRILLSLLKPNGFMSVALYSELARANYIAAQEFVAQRGYGSSPDEIRRFRQDFIASEDSPMRSAVLDCPDFYSISECRDLLFHVQEHRMTIPQLQIFFEENDLRFLGFGTDAQLRQTYAQRFPADETFANLDNWHTFEQENPATFNGMYQFWVQKGRTAA
jgi:Tfp pilus assembly protein PilF/SAM-dependent methyltransferase